MEFCDGKSRLLCRYIHVNDHDFFMFRIETFTSGLKENGARFLKSHSFRNVKRYKTLHLGQGLWLTFYFSIAI